MKQKIIKSLTPKEHLAILTELTNLLDINNPQKNVRGIQLLSLLAYNAGLRYSVLRLSQKGAKHVSKPPSSNRPPGSAGPKVTDA